MVQKSEANNFWRYPRDGENRLTEAATRKQKVRYKYDALGRRVRRYTPGVREDTKFTNDGLDVLVDDDAGTLTKYINGPGIDNKLRVQTGGSVNYFLTDHLGSTNGLADPSGAVGAQTSYDSFGNPSTNPGTRYQYTGREYDAFSGFYYYRARFYDSRSGRFVSEDPIGIDGGVNLFSYVRNTPMKFNDPSGKFPSMWYWKYHQGITAQSLAGIATESQIASLSISNQSFDQNTQDSLYAPYHAMRRYGQDSAESARDEANEFVRRKICQARDYEARRLPSSAMESLGQAMHTMQDVESPAHRDFQQAWPDTRTFTAVHVWHYIRETFFPGDDNIAAAENNTRRTWEYYKGAPMPRDILSNSGPTSLCGCGK
ncbi:MAG: hypothetical protein IT174_11250 [Acidobacteria bacterium]|nr:hypothetical protein [Acidobacteriota bacterium]